MARHYELTFVGGAMARYFPRYARWHATRESAEIEAASVFRRLRADGLPTACHQSEIHRVDDTSVSAASKATL